MCHVNYCKYTMSIYNSVGVGSVCFYVIETIHVVIGSLLIHQTLCVILLMYYDAVFIMYIHMYMYIHSTSFNNKTNRLYAQCTLYLM